MPLFGWIPVRLTWCPTGQPRSVRSYHLSMDDDIERENDDIDENVVDRASAQGRALANRGVFYTVNGDGASAKARESKLVGPLSAMQDAVDAQNFCSGYGATSSDGDEAAPVTFACRCGELSGEYPDYETANTVLDAHLDVHEEARNAFVEQWRAEHGMRARPSAI
jgi:hypothetical protein